MAREAPSFLLFCSFGFPSPPARAPARTAASAHRAQTPPPLRTTGRIPCFPSPLRPLHASPPHPCTISTNPSAPRSSRLPPRRHRLPVESIHGRSNTPASGHIQHRRLLPHHPQAAFTTPPPPDPAQPCRIRRPLVLHVRHAHGSRRRSWKPQGPDPARTPLPRLPDDDSGPSCQLPWEEAEGKEGRAGKIPPPAPRAHGQIRWRQGRSERRRCGRGEKGGDGAGDLGLLRRSTHRPCRGRAPPRR
ncbi:hypothetical protein SETIT_6G125600v2 [Setaria italica]|uniref:Uncharacterized protein n=1 Tax=Setaria italica TaxID=4555 RepID=A0A368RKT3_SETIT|nr:hypothetical protein SETIT_6G125600v2 [Setaria italica]